MRSGPDQDDTCATRPLPFPADLYTRLTASCPHELIQGFPQAMGETITFTIETVDDDRGTSLRGTAGLPLR
jgi:hypothetical protein